MIVFDFDVCPTLILTAILGKVLRFAMDVHICAHNRYLSPPTCRGCQNTVCACLIANKSSRMAIYRTCFFITFKPWLSMRVFLQACLATRVHDEVAGRKIY